MDQHCGQPRLHPSRDSEEPCKTRLRVVSSKIGRLRYLSTNPCPSQVEDRPWGSPSPALAGSPQTPVAPEKSPRQGGTGPRESQEAAVRVDGDFPCRCKWALGWARGHGAGQYQFLIHREPSHTLCFHTELFVVTGTQLYNNPDPGSGQLHLIGNPLIKVLG